jgi:hypothetical protein
MVSWRFCLLPTRIQKTPNGWFPRGFRTPKEVGGGRAAGEGGEGRPGAGRAGWAARGAPGRQGYVHVCFRMNV